jgi:ketosteroid isomerase-like protein
VSDERVERILDGYRLFNEGKLDQALEGFPDDIEWVVLDIVPDPGPYHGRDGVRRFWETWHETFQDFRIEILQAHDLDDHVVVIMRVRGTGRDSGAVVDTPTFPAVWTWREGEIARMQMFMSEDSASEAIGKDWR